MEVRPAGRPLSKEPTRGDYHELRFLVDREMFGRFAKAVHDENTTASRELRVMLAKWLAEYEQSHAI
jgi:hypothetical protein